MCTVTNRPRASQKHLVLVSRILILVLGLMAIIISLNRGSVLWSSWFGWTALGIVGMPLIIGLYWDKATKEGAIAGITSGFFYSGHLEPMGFNE